MRTIWRRDAVRVGALALGVIFLLGSKCQTKVEEKVLTILHTNDLHSHLEASKASPFGFGGLARLATRVQERQAEAEGPVIRLDAGDFSEGTWFYSIDAGINMLRILDRMDFDATVIGNHEYLVGPDVLLDSVLDARSEGIEVPYLAANMDLVNYQRAEEFKETFPDWVIIEREGLKIGVLGLTTFDVEYVSYLDPVGVIEPVAKAQDLAKILRPQVDVLVVLSHNSFSVNRQIAKAVLGVDAVISGHSHDKLGQATLVKNAGREVPVVETGEWGEFLGELKLSVNKTQKIVKFESYQLFPINSSLDEDSEIRSLVEAEKEKLNQKFEPIFGSNIFSPIAQTEIDLDHSDSHRASLGNLATKGYRSATAAEAALEILPLTGVRLVEGDLTIQNLHDVMPHIYDPKTGLEWTIKLWQARGEDLRFLIEAFYVYAKLLPFSKAGFLGMDGIEVVWRPGQPVEILEIRVLGQILQDSQIYEVAMTDGFLLAMYTVGDLLGLSLDLSQIEDTGIEGWRSVVDYGMQVEVLTEEGLRSGGRDYVADEDLAVFPYRLDYSNGKLRVRVSNEGLSASSPSVLRCSHGKVDDWIGYQTENEAPYVEIGETEIPPLASVEDVVLEMNWTPNGPGHWPVNCEILVGDSDLTSNNEAHRLLRI